MIVLLSTIAATGQSTYHNWPIGTWHVVRHLSHHRTVRLTWKLVPFHKPHGRRIKFYFGTEGYDPDTVFAWIRCSVNGKPVSIPRIAYEDCGNGYEFGWEFDGKQFIGDTWAVAEHNGNIEIATMVGAHGGKEPMSWFIRDGRFIGRKWGYDPNRRVEG